MSLRDFIRATARDVQATLKPTPEPEAEQEGTSAGGEPGQKRKEKKAVRRSEDEDNVQKRRRKERAQKTIHEEQRAAGIVSAQETLNPAAEGRAELETVLPPSDDGTMSVPVVQVEDEEENGDRAETSAGPGMYQPQWPNILEDTMLNAPLLRAEWVARSLPPAEMKVYARADTFDICDMANRAAILSTVAAHGMQRLLCSKDKQIEKLRDEGVKAKAAVKKADGVMAEALRREKNLEREVDRLRMEAGEVPSLKTQLAEAQATIELLKAEVDHLTAQGVVKDEEIEIRKAAELKSAQDLVAATGSLFAERQTRHYLMTSGIGEILSKVRSSHEYGKFVAGLIPPIQALGKSELIKKMRHDYFPNVKPEDIPYFVPDAEAVAEDAFQKLRSAPFESHILTQLAANPDMSEEEIRSLENPDLLSG